MFVHAGEFLEETEQEVESRLSPLSREITDSRVKTQEELDDLYNKIVLYILLRSSMGSPTDAKTMQEAKGLLFNLLETQIKCSAENNFPSWD